MLNLVMLLQMLTAQADSTRLAVLADSLRQDSIVHVQQKWKLTTENALGLAQSSYSDNWQGEEAGSLIWIASNRSFADKWLSKSLLWNNVLQLEFGQTHSQSKERHWQKPVEYADRFRFDSILKVKRVLKAVDPYAAFTFESQFLDATGVDKRYLNPIDMTESIGVARDIFNKPNVRVLATRFGFGVRQRIWEYDILLPDGSNGSESIFNNDGGFEWVTDLVVGSGSSKYFYITKLGLFKALFDSRSSEIVDDSTTHSDEREYWKTIDLNYFHNLQLYLITPFYTDYTSPKIKRYMVKSHDEYGYEPYEISPLGYNFSMLGYDIGLYFLSALQQYGRNFQQCIDQVESDQLLTRYRFLREGTGGFSNTNFVLIQYKKGFIIEKISILDGAPVY